MIDFGATAVVTLFGFYLVLLGCAAILAPGMARQFLLGFARSPTAHYLELGFRLAVGLAFVRHGPAMMFPSAFSAFGWLLIVTTTGLASIPWRWHRRFAEQAVPRMLPYLTVVGLVSLAFGVLVLVAG